MNLEFAIQVILFQLAFLLVYEIWLKKETFFNYNRFYLLLTPLLAILLPFLNIELLSQTAPAEAFRSLNTIWLPEVIIGGGNTSEDHSGVTQQSVAIDMANWWIIIYFSGIIVSLILLGLKLKKLNQLSKHSIIRNFEGFKIYEVKDSNIAFTFFNRVFIGEAIPEEEQQQIMAHELVHVREKHSLDLLIFEILKIFLWFNPVVYLYQNRLATIHEFIADKAAVQTSGRKTYYEQLLNTAFGVQNISFINQFFNHSLIKKRIIMLQKKNSKTISKFKFLIIIPLMLAMLTYVACSENDSETITADSSLSEYSYTLTKGKEMTTQNKATHTKYEDFLLNNPEYVSWATIESNQITYTVHHVDEEVPSGYRKMEVNFPQGGSYIMYMNLHPDSSKEKSPREMKPIKIDNDQHSKKEIPFALIDQVPTFPECKELASHQEQKDCVSREISLFVNKNFDTSLGKKLGLTGIHRVIVQFRIDESGNITDIKSRAPKPELEKEAERVIASLPQMEPGIHRGKKVSVMYSLPIAFKVGE